MKRPVIVLTPVKNEAWVLDRFLMVTSLFADAIILADQNSTDESRKICNRYSKVTLIHNPEQNYSEAYRQQILWKTAQSMFQGDKLILALDADEIATADSLEIRKWEQLRNAPVGTIFAFEKPDLLPGAKDCIRHVDSPFPMAIVADDNISVNGTSIHSARVPIIGNATVKIVKDIVFLHYSYVRPNFQRAKFRFYTVHEAVNKISPWYRRRRYYRSPNHLFVRGTPVPLPSNWVAYANEELCPIVLDESEVPWYDDVVLQVLLKEGAMKFWFDDIWDKSWGNGITPPPKVLLWLLSLSDKWNK